MPGFPPDNRAPPCLCGTKEGHTAASLVGQINGEFGEVGVAAVHYLRRSLPFDELIGMYRAADVMLVTPFCDGMNLVAKEYVASRVDDTGVLILSEFAGPAEELTAAILVNPHDVDALAEAVHRGLNMPPKEQARRMRGLRKVVRTTRSTNGPANFLGRLRNPAREPGAAVPPKRGARHRGSSDDSPGLPSRPAPRQIEGR